MLTSREILEGYLNESGGLDLVAELTRFFSEKVPQRLDLASSAVESRDLAALKYQLHSLKNSFLNIGALGVADEVQLMEQKAELASSEDFQQGLKSLRQKYEVIRNELGEFLASRVSH